MSKNHHGTYESKISVFERLGTKPKNQIGSNNLNKYDIPHKLNSTEPGQITGKMKKAKHGKKVKVKHRKSRSEQLANLIETPSLLLDLDLEGADEKFLQRRKLQLQRELRLQLKQEKSSVRKTPLKNNRKSSRDYSSSSDSSSDSSSSSSSTSSSYHSKCTSRKRKCSPSSDSDDSIPEKKRKSPKSNSKSKVEVKKKSLVYRKVETPKKQTVVKKSVSPNWDKRPSPVKKRSPPRSKPRPSSPKHRAREPSPKRPVKERRPSPPSRPRSPDRRHVKHSPRPRHGGLEKGGKILPVKSSAYMKEMKETLKRKTPDRLRDEKERQRAKEKRRREEKAREVERREREAEKAKRETVRQKERDDALQRCRERQRERERMDRSDRDKRVKEFDRKDDTRKLEVKSDLPSLLDIKTEAPKEQGRRVWDDRRQRRMGDDFDFRRIQRNDLDVADDRRGRKGHDYIGDSWSSKEDFQEPPPPQADWGRDWKPRTYDGKWSSEGSRDGKWREHYGGRRPADWHPEPPPNLEASPLNNRLPTVEHARRPAETVVELAVQSDPTPVDASVGLEQALSDISDDPDEILNQVDEPAEDPSDEVSQIAPISISQPSADFFFDSRRPLLDCLSDRGLDFEEISDEELEEEAKMSKGIMDVLGADWESLMSKVAPKSVKVESNGSARRRWRADYIISRIGISQQLAGEEFMTKYLKTIQNGENDRADSADTKKNKIEPHDESNLERDALVKSEFAEMKMQHLCPAIHAMLAEMPEPSPLSHLLNSKFKHALSARTDLSIRRVACGLSSKEPLQVPPCDSSLYETSVALFKSAVA